MGFFWLHMSLTIYMVVPDSRTNENLNKIDWAEGILYAIYWAFERFLILNKETTPISKSKTNKNWQDSRRFGSKASRPPKFINPNQIIDLGSRNVGSKILKVWQSPEHLRMFVRIVKCSFICLFTIEIKRLHYHLWM